MFNIEKAEKKLERLQDTYEGWLWRGCGDKEDKRALAEIEKLEDQIYEYYLEIADLEYGQ